MSSSGSIVELMDSGHVFGVTLNLTQLNSTEGDLCSVLVERPCGVVSGISKVIEPNSLYCSKKVSNYSWACSFSRVGQSASFDRRHLLTFC